MRFYIRTFGCQMNVYDSELVRDILLRAGFEEVDNPEEADIVFSNTCSVRQKAEERGVKFLRDLKKRGKITVMLGCVAQQHKRDTAIPGVDLAFGTRSYQLLPQIILNYIRGIEPEKRIFAEDYGLLELTDTPLKRKARSISELINIMQGCNNFCSYCIVPFTRGREISRPAEHILQEAKNLEKQGVVEITLLGQNVNSYFDGKFQFYQLLEYLDKNTNFLRIRFTTSHPRDITYNVLRVIADSKSVTDWIHLPLQAGSTRVLKLMRRGYTKEEYIEIAKMIRKVLPESTITTDIMVGFPGEEEKDFEETLEVVKTVEFDHAFTFIYSPRPGTAAAQMKDSVPPETKGKWLRILIEEVNRVARIRREKMIGKFYEFLVEGESRKDSNLSAGRNRGFIKAVITEHFPPGTLLIGKVVDVRGLAPIVKPIRVLERFELREDVPAIK